MANEPLTISELATISNWLDRMERSNITSLEDVDTRMLRRLYEMAIAGQRPEAVTARFNGELQYLRARVLVLTAETERLANRLARTEAKV